MILIDKKDSEINSTAEKARIPILREQQKVFFKEKKTRSIENPMIKMIKKNINQRRESNQQ